MVRGPTALWTKGLRLKWTSRTAPPTWWRKTSAWSVNTFIIRGVATAGTRGTRHPCTLPCHSYIKMITDSLSSEMTF